MKAAACKAGIFSNQPVHPQWIVMGLLFYATLLFHSRLHAGVTGASSYPDTPSGVFGCALDTSRHTIYFVGDLGSDDICFYSLESDGSIVSARQNIDIAVVSQLRTVALDPLKSRLYAGGASQQLAVCTLDAVGGIVGSALSADLVYPINALALDPQRGRLYLAMGNSIGLRVFVLDSNGDLVSADPKSTAYSTTGLVQTLALDAERRVLYLGCGDAKLRYFLLDANGDPASPVYTPGFAANTQALVSLALNSTRERLYGITGSDTYLHLYSLDTFGIPLSRTSFTASGENISVLALNAAQSRMYCGASNHVYWCNLDPDTGLISGSYAGPSQIVTDVRTLALDPYLQKLYSGGTLSNSKYFFLDDPAMIPIQINSGATSTGTTGVTLNLGASNPRFFLVDSEGGATGLLSFSYPAGSNFDQWISADGDGWSNDSGASRALTLNLNAVLKSGAGSKSVKIWYMESTGASNVSAAVFAATAQIALDSGTPTSTPAVTASRTFTSTVTSSPSATRTASPSSTPSISASPTPTITFSSTTSQTPSRTGTPSATFSAALSHTYTLTPTTTMTGSPTLTRTSTPVDTSSPTLTQTFSLTRTPSGSFTTTLTPSRTESTSASLTGTYSATPTFTRTVTESLSPTQSLSRTASPLPSFTQTRAGSPTNSPARTRTGSATPILTVTTTQPPSGTPTPAAVFYLDKNQFIPGTETLGMKIGLLEAGEVTVKVFTLTGRKVWNTQRSLPAPGYLHLQWDGRNEAGEPVATGLYYVLLEGLGQKMVRKVLAVR